MIRIIQATLILFWSCTVYTQVNNHIYQLNEIHNLLTEDVQHILDTKLENKKVVFLGESEHHIGSDFVAKTEFVKYLVLEQGYKDIAFEGDFFGLYFDHNKEDLFSFWSNSVQCKELFEFLKKYDVTIWGFDNQMGSGYTYLNFTDKLREFLNQNSIFIEDEFITKVELYIKNRKELSKVLNKTDFDYLIATIEKLLKKDSVLENQLWFQILSSFKSDIQIHSTHKSNKKGIPLRDTQMASNLNFLTERMPNKKFIVWLANAHMAKYEYDFMRGQTMGAQFVHMNPEISYHIATSSIYMPYRKEKWIKRSSENDKNLLHLLPTTERNYFIDSKQLISERPEYAEKEFEGMFNLNKAKTNWFKHFDALIFVSKGERVKYMR